MPWRLGMAVTRKAGCAVFRNRLRRLVREVFRLLQHSVPTGWDFVVVPKKRADFSRVSCAEVQEELAPIITGSIREGRAGTAKLEHFQRKNALTDGSVSAVCANEE